MARWKRLTLGGMALGGAAASAAAGDTPPPIVKTISLPNQQSSSEDLAHFAEHINDCLDALMTIRQTLQELEVLGVQVTPLAVGELVKESVKRFYNKATRGSKRPAGAETAEELE